MKVLIVEDDRTTARLYGRHLRAAGFLDIEFVQTMHDAYVIMRRLPPPGMIFLDIFLPDSRSPEETLSHMLAFREINPDAIIIVMTGLPSEKIAVLARAMGADEFQFKEQMGSQAALLAATKRALEKGRNRLGNVEASQKVLDRLAEHFSKMPPPQAT